MAIPRLYKTRTRLSVQGHALEASQQAIDPYLKVQTNVCTTKVFAFCLIVLYLRMFMMYESSCDFFSILACLLCYALQVHELVSLFFHYTQS